MSYFESHHPMKYVACGKTCQRNNHLVLLYLQVGKLKLRMLLKLSQIIHSTFVVAEKRITFHVNILCLPS